MMRACLAFVFCVLLSFSSLLVAQDKALQTWKTLALLNIETGQAPPKLQQLDRQNIEIAGFIVPLEMDGYIDKVKEFLLVPDPLSCIHVPPPPPNQIIYVKMNRAIPLDMDLRGVLIKGRLDIVNKNILDETVGFTLWGYAAKAANLEVDDPLLELLEHYQ
eukprot:COSAG01_NODE_2642_length_7323_cov_13.197121_3_plen_161_part_00